MGINTDINYRYSGGAAGVAVGSLGGSISANEIVSSQDENLFRDIDDPSTAKTQYYCIYLINKGTETYNDIGLYISTSTPSIDTQVFVGLGTSPVNGTEQTVGDNVTEPTGVSWTQRYFDYNALTIASLAVNQYKAIWLKMLQDADASAVVLDYVRLTLVDAGAGGVPPGSVVEVFSDDFSVDFQ